ncbi:MAG: prephenate dehydrogenase [Anaerolineales bacterium]|nr:prephenate dehydrogenase [Anaerolineales bacterium]
MSKPRITIVGLGFIGGSIGLALHQAEADFEVVGHDRERGAANQAKKIGAVDKTDWNLVSACEDADLIVIAVPVGGIKDTLAAIGPYLKPGCLITDTASIKSPVIEWAEEILPEEVNFVGGNPIVRDAGTTGTDPSSGGIDAARADLFSGAIYCLTPAAGTASDAVRLASDFVYLLGAKPYFLDPLEHDGLMAGVDHLPFVLSAALLGVTTESASWREMRRLAGGAFENATRFVSADPTTYRDACLVNRENIVRWIDAWSGKLGELKELIQAGDAKELGRVFEEAMIARQRWLRAREEGNWEGQSPEMPTMTGFMGQLFGLGRLGKRKKQD